MNPPESTKPYLPKHHRKPGGLSSPSLTAMCKSYGGQIGVDTCAPARCSSKRATNVRKALTDLGGSNLVWVTDVARVSKETVLSGAIRMDSEGEESRIVKA